MFNVVVARVEYEILTWRFLDYVLDTESPMEELAYGITKDALLSVRSFNHRC